MKAFERRGLILGVQLIVGLLGSELYAGTWYWDTNGSTAGAGGSPSGTWGTSSFWTQSSAGTTAASLYTTTSADTLYFVAGAGTSSGENAFTVTVTGNQYANGLAFQSSGAATLAGTGAIVLGSGGINVAQYAYGTSAQGVVHVSPEIVLQSPATFSNSSTNSFTTAGFILNSGNELTFGGSGNAFVTGPIWGSGGLAESGPGQLSLLCANYFTGPTTVSGGSLDISYAGALQSSTLIAPATGVVVFDQNVASRVYDIGALSGSGNLALANNATTPAAVTLSVGGFNANTTYSGILSGSGALIEVGSGSLMLSATNNSYSGGTTVTSGTAIITNTGALPSFSTSAAKLTVGNSGTLTLNLGGSGWTATNVGSLLAANSGGFVAGSTLAVDTTNASGVTTFGFTIPGNLGLAKLGPNGLSLTTTNAFTGTTSVSAGTLNLANSGSLAGSTLIAPTVATLAFDPSVHAFTLGGLSGGGSLSLQNGSAIALTVGGNNSNTVYAGALSGSGSLTKGGSGALVLIGVNTFSGGTTLSGGTLQLGDGTSGHDGVLPSSGISDNSSLVFNLNNAETYAGTISGTGGLTQTSGLLVLTATSGFSGGTAIGGGTLQLGDGASGQDGALSASGGIFNNGTLAYDLYGSQTYAGAISGSGSLVKNGSGTLVLSGTNSLFLGTTTISAGTLTLAGGGALQSSTLIAPISGAVVFAQSVSAHAFSLGGLSGSGNIALQTSGTAPAAVALTIGGNNASTIYIGRLSGSGSLTKIGIGTLDLTGSNSCNGFSLAAGGLQVSGTGSLTTTGTSSLLVGTNSPAAIEMQDSSALRVGGNFDLNYQNTTGNASTLTLTGGSLVVAGKTYIGEATMRTGPATTSASFLQSGGIVAFNGSTTVGDNGTAMSLLNVNGGSMTIAGGLVVGNQGNGAANIQGSGVVNVTGSQGLAIGDNPALATCGSVSISSGTLDVSGNLTLGGGGGIGYFVRSGGALSVSGSLAVAGTSQLVLDATVANVSTTFSGLIHSVGGTLIVIPETASLSSSESISFTSAPALTDGLLGTWAVLANSGTNSSGDYLTTTGTGTKSLAKASYVSFSSSTGTSVVLASSSSTLSHSTSAYAVSFGSATTTLASTATLTIGSGGMILNGGTVIGGAIAIPQGVLPLVYTGSTYASTIATALAGDAGLAKFGPGNLLLEGNNNSLSGNVQVSAGMLSVGSASALNASCPVTVAAGATLAIQGNTALGSTTVTLNGTGEGGSGALFSVTNDSFSGTLNLGSDSEVNTSNGTLALVNSVQGNFALTKSGTGTLVLAGASGSQFPLTVTVAQGTLRIQNADGLGPGGTSLGAIVDSGATLQLQGGIAVGNVPLTLNGTGTGGNGALENLQGANSWSGVIALAADSQVTVDSASDSLTLSGVIGGGFDLTKSGAGNLLLTGSNTFTGALNVAAGTLTVASVNQALASGPLGAGAEPVTLGSGSAMATFVYTGTGTISNRAFTLGAGTLATGGGGMFQVGSSLGLNGMIGGNGSLTKTGSGALTLGGSNVYTGVTTVSAGTLAIGPTGSINASSDIFINQGGVLQVTAGTGGGSQLPSTGNITFSGGMLSYTLSVSSSPGASVGALLLNPGQGQVVLSNAGSGTPYLQFASGTPHMPGTTLGLSMSNAQIQFLANPPVMTNGILPYAFVGPVNSTTVDFATLSTSGGPTLVSAYSGYANSMGTSGSLNVAATASQSLTTATSCNSLKLVGPASITMSSPGSLTLNSGGLICTGSSSVITGGTISAPGGELIVNTATNLNISSVISASTALTKTGTATLTLTNTSPIAGSTFINQGTLAYAPTANLAYSQSIAGGGNLLMAGTGTMLTLSGSDTYTGSTTVTEGTLCVNGSLAGGGPIILQNGTVLSGSGSVAGGVSINSGTATIGQQGPGSYLTIGSGVNVSGSGSIVASSTAAMILGNLNYTSSANSTYSGAIVGAASTVTLDAPASATLTLSGSNGYGGGTFLESGTLHLSNSAALGTGKLTITGGTLDVDGSVLASLTNSGGLITTSGSGMATLVVNAPANGEKISGGVTGAVNLELASGSLILSGTNSYTGGTIVNGGELLVGNGTALPSGTNLTVGTNAGADFGGIVPDASSYPASEPVIGISAAVPESGTLVLLFSAALGVGFIRLRRKVRWQS
jgi:fibronectin-binding autotransporter adhesin